MKLEIKFYKNPDPSSVIVQTFEGINYNDAKSKFRTEYKGISKKKITIISERVIRE